MRKIGWAFLCGMLLGAVLPYGPALAVANDPIAAAQGEQSARDQAAAAQAQYLQIWIKDYDAAAGDLPASDQPPLDILALAHGTPVLKQAAGACGAQAGDLKTISALFDCTNTAVRTMVAAEKLRDTRLFNSFITTVTLLGADADAGKLPGADAVQVYGILGTTFDRAIFFEFQNWLDHVTPAMAPGSPPYDVDALAAAGPAAKAARAACEDATARKNGAATLACLADGDAKFRAAMKMQDTRIADITAPFLRQAAADVDAGRMSQAELLWLHDYLQLATLAVMDDRYGVYLGRSYAALFEKNYAAAQAAHGKYVADAPPTDVAAATAAHAALNAADAACEPPEAFKSSLAWVSCHMDATKAFVAADKMRDMDLFNAYADTARTVGADTDAGKMTAPQQDTVLNAVEAAYNLRIRQEEADFEVRADKPLIDGYVARFDKAYAAAKAPPDADNSPPYDSAAMQAAQVDRQAAESQCTASRAQFKTNLAWVECYLSAYRAYYAAIKALDKELLDTFATAQEAAAADIDAGKLTSVQGYGVVAALSEDENAILSREFAAYQTRLLKPLLDSYVARFDKAYADAIAAHPLDLTMPPYDTATIVAAEAARIKASAACDARNASFKTRRAMEDCYLDATRAYALATRQRDTALLDSYTAAQQAVAGDADAGKLTYDQGSRITAAISGHYTDQLNKEQTDYRNKPIMDAYVARFEKAYGDARAGHGPINPDAAPFDLSVTTAAASARSAAQDRCDARSGELTTMLAMVNCYMDTSRIYFATIKIQDQDLVDNYIAAEQAAAADTDAGKLSHDQGYAARTAIQKAANGKMAKQERDYEARTAPPAGR